jgi:glycogen(starch) synthase
VRILLIVQFSEEEDPDEYPFPLTLRTKRSTGPTSPNPEAVTNGGGV